MQQTKTLQAKMFGGLQIHVGDQYLVEKGGRVNKPIELLVYLLLNIGVQVSNEQIMEALWGDDEVENPAGALKNAAYSLRRLLTKAGLDQDCIITRERQYAWNPDVPVELDIDRFNELYETAMQTPGTSADQVMACCREALALYAGDFLPALSDRYWLMARASTLRQRYLSMVLHLSDMLLNGSDRTGAEEVMNLCSRALLLEPLSEDLYLRYFTALRKMDMKAAVLSYYPVVANMFLDEVGNPCPNRCGRSTAGPPRAPTCPWRTSATSRRIWTRSPGTTGPSGGRISALTRCSSTCTTWWCAAPPAIPKT